MRFLFVLPLLLSACAAPPLAQPTPNIGATVQSQVRATLTAVPAPTPVMTVVLMPTSQPAPAATSTALRIGERGVLAVKDQPTIYVADTEGNLARLLKAMTARDAMGMAEMESRFTAIGIPSGTRVLVIDESALGDVRALKVRTLLDDGSPLPLAVFWAADWWVQRADQIP